MRRAVPTTEIKCRQVVQIMSLFYFEQGLFNRGWVFGTDFDSPAPWNSILALVMGGEHSDLSQHRFPV